jgi:hypothetical protein
MARCPHKNVQQFTECCLDCGRNIYETDEEYLQYLRNLKKDDEIQRLEKELGINHPGNQSDDWYPNKYPDM